MTGSPSIAENGARRRRASALRPARAKQRKTGHDTQADSSRFSHGYATFIGVAVIIFI